MLTVRDLWKSFGDIQVLRGVNLTLAGGSLAVLTGPNGSGKTTLLKLVAGILKPSRGYIAVYGFKPGSFEARRLTSIVLDRPLLYEDLTVRENLELFKTLTGVSPGPYYGAAIEKLSITRVLERRVRELSHGWRRRVDFVRALIGNPKLLLFDEVTTAFDRDSLEAVAEILWDAVRGGSIVVAIGASESQLSVLHSYATHRCTLEGGVVSCEAT